MDRKWEITDKEDKCPKCGLTLYKLTDDKYVYAEECQRGCYRLDFDTTPEN